MFLGVMCWIGRFPKNHREITEGSKAGGLNSFASWMMALLGEIFVGYSLFCECLKNLCIFANRNY